MIVTAANLSDVLQQLTYLGQPRVAYSTVISPGWHANIELPAPPGCKAQVASSFNCRSAEAAVQEMVDRLEALRGSSVADQAANPKLKLVASR